MSGDWMRAEFERWMSGDGKFPQAVRQDESGSYLLMTAATAWTTWLAAWTTIADDMQSDVQNAVASRDGYRREAADLYAALEPFTEHCSSDETITITVRTEDVRRARAALLRASGAASDGANRADASINTNGVR